MASFLGDDLSRHIGRLSLPSSTVIRASWNDLTLNERRCCDDLMEALGKANRLDVLPNHDNRKPFWKMVFRGWTTKDVIIKPAPLPHRSSGEASVRVGTLKTDCPQSLAASRKRKWDPEVAPPVPVERRRGAPVRLRLYLDKNDTGLVYQWTDMNGVLVPGTLVELDENTTQAQAQARVIRHWDECEIERVGRWNEKMATYLARKRLLNRLQGHDHAARGLGPAAGPAVYESDTELLPLRLASDIVAPEFFRMAEMILELPFKAPLQDYRERFREPRELSFRIME